MKKLTKTEKHLQCLKEIKWTLLLALCCGLWHVISAFLLNGKDIHFLGMPAWFSVSVLGCMVIAAVGLWLLLKYVFVDFEYDDNQDEEEENSRRPE